MRQADLADNRQLDPVLDFLRLLWRIEHGLQRASKRMEASFGVTGPQRLTLRIVGRFPDLSAGELAHIIQLHPSTVTGILHRLTSRRLLDRQKDPADSRRIRLRLKRPAERLTGGSSGTVERAVTDVFSQMESSKIAAAREVLTAFAGALQDVNESTGRERPRAPRRVRRRRHRRTRRRMP